LWLLYLLAASSLQRVAVFLTFGANNNYMQLGIIGSGSWATALAKICTDNKESINWCVRSEEIVNHLKHRHHNPGYLSSVYFDTNILNLSTDIAATIAASDCVLIAVPSAYVIPSLSALPANAFEGKKVISAVKGILPDNNLLLNDYLKDTFNMPLSDYFTVMGPCHAEEVASEKLSYLTFSGIDVAMAEKIAGYFTTEYLNTIVNSDVYGVQYAAVLKNLCPGSRYCAWTRIRR
jgi:glycerol-3-phosphate dehydrogenase (NAD(P)+)